MVRGQGDEMLDLPNEMRRVVEAPVGAQRLPAFMVERDPRAAPQRPVFARQQLRRAAIIFVGEPGELARRQAGDVGQRLDPRGAFVHQPAVHRLPQPPRSEEHTSAPHSLMRISYAVLCLNTKQTRSTYGT